MSSPSALEIFEAEGNVHGQALVLRNAALVDRMRGELRHDARQVRRGAGRRCAPSATVIGEANILRSLAKFRIDEGDVDEAEELLAKALALCRGVHYLRGEAQVVGPGSPSCTCAPARSLQARQALHSVLRTVREIGDRIGEAHALYGLGVVRRREGRLDSAEATLVHALSVAERVGERMIEGQSRYALGEIAVVRGRHRGRRGSTSAKARDTFGELGSSLWLAKTLILRSEVHETGGRVREARQDLEEATELLSRIDSKETARLLLQLEEARSALFADGIVGVAGIPD